jgi:hypothetical protein
MSGSQRTIFSTASPGIPSPGSAAYSSARLTPVDTRRVHADRRFRPQASNFVALAPYCGLISPSTAMAGRAPLAAGWRIDFESTMPRWSGMPMPAMDELRAVALRPEHVFKHSSWPHNPPEGPFVVFDGERLVAMAGSGCARQVPRDSGVCTPEFQGRGSRDGGRETGPPGDGAPDSLPARRARQQHYSWHLRANGVS